MDITPEQIIWIKEVLGIQEVFDVEKLRSAEENKVLRFHTSKGDYIFKIGPELAAEKDRLLWLDGKLPAPKVVGWREGKENDELLMNCIEGNDLASLVKKTSPEEIAKLMAKALKLVHNLDISDCPFGEKKEGSVFIHGDACLPNYMIAGNELSGFIDLGRSGIGQREDDLAAAVWSLNFNHCREAAQLFLQLYGIENTEETDVERLIKKYEGNWSERFAD